VTPDDIRQQIQSACASNDRVLILLAGSNGAGKTTYYERFLADTGLPFVNADEIARQLGAVSTTPELSFATEAMHRADARRRLFVASRQPSPQAIF
jgi:predicted ABC-type ATPase